MESLKGKTLKNRYRVDEELGRGGMAEVYKAFDQKRAGFVAIKLLREDLSRDKVFIRRFDREAKTLAQLQHRNIVRFYGIERDALDVFIVMDFIEGKTLRDLIFSSKGPLSIKKITDILEPICSGLHYAHEMGIAHCDIKPANIILAKNGEVMVSDFGIARSMDAATSTLIGVGTPAYMAPELIKGEDPTPQSDIYSLGITLYEMLTGGERPFTGEHASITGTTAEKVRWEHLYGKVISPRKRNKTIPKYIEDTVMKCLDKDPKNRFQSVQELLYAFTHEETKEEKKVQLNSKESKDKVKESKQKREKLSGKEEDDPEDKNIFTKIITRVKKEWNLMTKQAKTIVIAVGSILLISNFIFAYLAFKPHTKSSIDIDNSSEAQMISESETLTPTNTPIPIPQCELIDSTELVSGWQENYCAAFRLNSEVSDWLVDDQINERVAVINVENYKEMLNVRAEMFQDLITYIKSPTEELRDYMVSVEGRLSSYSGNPYHKWGLVLKADRDNYYYFSIDSKNNYYFNLMREGNVSNILNGRFSNDILPIDQVNRLTVVVDGYEFKLYINGVLQTTIKDNRILKGETGLYLDMGANTTLDWEFDNFVIYAPSD